MAVSSKPSYGVVSLSNVTKQITPFVSKASSIASSALATSKAVLDKYPPVKSFVYALAGASAVPVAVFAGYTATTLGGVLAVAGTSVAFVEGFFVVIGGFILSWFLFAALVIAAIAAFWFTGAYYIYQLGKRLETSF